MKIFFIICLMCSNVMLYSQFKSLIEVGDSVEMLRKLMIDPDSIRLSNLLSEQLPILLRLSCQIKKLPEWKIQLWSDTISLQKPMIKACQEI